MLAISPEGFREHDFGWVLAVDRDKALLQGKAYLVAKRLLDLTLTLLSAPAWLTLIGVIALLIKLDDPGAPVFFRQKRTGRHGKRFGMYKFRTMVPNAEALKEKYMHLNELQWPDFKISNDPRVTRIGKFLRKTSLDELPQLFNVVVNDMSLVGPRPTSFGPERYELWQTERFDVTPGITGLWQIVARGESEFADRLRLDIMYIEHRSLWLDIMILWRTFTAVLRMRGRH